jgi:hypothetical protein
MLSLLTWELVKGKEEIFSIVKVALIGKV